MFISRFLTRVLLTALTPVFLLPAFRTPAIAGAKEDERRFEERIATELADRVAEALNNIENIRRSPKPQAQKIRQIETDARQLFQIVQDMNVGMNEDTFWRKSVNERGLPSNISKHRKPLIITSTVFASLVGWGLFGYYSFPQDPVLGVLTTGTGAGGITAIISGVAIDTFFSKFERWRHNAVLDKRRLAARKKILKIFWDRLRAYGYRIPNSDPDKWFEVATSGTARDNEILISAKRLAREIELFRDSLKDVAGLLARDNKLDERNVILGIANQLPATNTAARLLGGPGWMKKAFRKLVTAKEGFATVARQFGLDPIIDIDKVLEPPLQFEDRRLLSVFDSLQPENAQTRMFMNLAGISMVTSPIFEISNLLSEIDAPLSINIDLREKSAVSEAAPVGASWLLITLGASIDGERIETRFDVPFNTREATPLGTISEKAWVAPLLMALETPKTALLDFREKLAAALKKDGRVLPAADLVRAVQPIGELAQSCAAVLTGKALSR